MSKNTNELKTCISQSVSYRRVLRLLRQGKLEYLVMSTPIQPWTFLVVAVEVFEC